MKDAGEQPGGGQLPTFRAREYDREYVARQEKQDRKRRRLAHMFSPVWLLIDLINDLFVHANDDDLKQGRQAPAKIHHIV